MCSLNHLLLLIILLEHNKLCYNCTIKKKKKKTLQSKIKQPPHGCQNISSFYCEGLSDAPAASCWSVRQKGGEGRGIPSVPRGVFWFGVRQRTRGGAAVRQQTAQQPQHLTVTTREQCVGVSGRRFCSFKSTPTGSGSQEPPDHFIFCN